MVFEVEVLMLEVEVMLLEREGRAEPVQLLNQTLSVS